MYDHVSHKTAKIRESPLTLAASVWSLARVSKQVCHQMTTFRESLLTHVTSVWFIAHVCPYVSDQTAGFDNSIRLQTHTTSMWLKPSVNLFVTSKEAGRTKSLMTHITRISFLNIWTFEPTGTVSQLGPWTLHLQHHLHVWTSQNPHQSCLLTADHTTRRPLPYHQHVHFHLHQQSTCWTKQSIFTTVRGHFNRRSFVPDEGKSSVA